MSTADVFGVKKLSSTFAANHSNKTRNFQNSCNSVNYSYVLP
jgi:hypothetical protein